MWHRIHFKDSEGWNPFHVWRMTRGVEQKKIFYRNKWKNKRVQEATSEIHCLMCPSGPDHFTLHYAQPNILLFLWCSQCNFCRGLNKIFELHWFCWDNAESSSLEESDALLFFFTPISSSSFYIFFSFQVKCHFFVSGHKKLQKINTGK